MNRRRRLNSVARSLISSRSQRRFAQTSQRDVRARSANARAAITPVANRRYARYTQPRAYTGRSRYQVESRANRGVAAGRFVGMAH